MTDKGDLSNEVRLMIERGKRDAAAGFFLIGKALCLAKDNGIHRAEGLTFLAYISQPEIAISWAGAHQMMAVFRRFGHLPNLEGIHPSRLIELTPCKDLDATEGLEKARDLTARDFKNYVRELRGKPTPEQCAHGRTYVVCEDCRKRVG